MFIFMEGLPRSGKSYETASQYILKSLKEGRPIDAYIEGLNFEQFAELAELPIEKVKELLVQITREQVPEIYKHTRKNALVVIDELQNFFQAGRQPMSDEMTKFLTEHGHEGQDIIGMGQDLNDVHKLWRNRCQRKFVFEKQDAIGRDGHYKWTAYRAIRAKNGLKFEKINSGTRKYEEKYFGLYASHSEGVSNFDTFKDDRTNIFKTAGVTFYLPLFLCVFAYAGYHIYGVFSGGGITNAPSVSIEQQIDQDIARQQQKIAPPTEIAVAAAPVLPTAIPVVPPKSTTPEMYLKSIADQYRLRLAAVLKRADGTLFVRIQAFDGTFHLKEYFTEKEIAALGWEIEQTEYGVNLIKGETQLVVRSWPIDPFGKISQSNQSNI